MPTELQVTRRNRLLTALHQVIPTTRQLAKATALSPGAALKELTVLEKLGLVRGFLRKQGGQRAPSYHWRLVPERVVPGKIEGTVYSILNDQFIQVRDA